MTDGKLSIAIVAPYYPPVIGGAENQAKNTASALQKLGHRVTVITRGPQGLPRITVENGITVYRTPETMPATRLSALKFHCAVLRALFAMRKEIDVIHAYLISSTNMACLLAAKILGKPFFISAGGAGACGGITDTMGFGAFSGLKRTLLIKSRTRFILQTEESKAEFVAAGVNPARITVIPTPVDTEQFHPATSAEKSALRAELGLDGTVLFSLSRLEEPKKPEWIIEALPALLKRWPDLQLVIAGGGSKRDFLVKFAEETGVAGNVTFAGIIPRAEDYYRASDIFVLASESEGMPNTLLEAMACAVAPVCARVNGSSVIKEGETGFLFPAEKNIPALTEALQKALSLNAEQKTVLREKLRQTAQENFAPAIIAARHMALFREAV
ncbi:MAG: glycosyltransferase family 4 protein [Elusimicrobiaceae bacterium]|jgi:glycosyltransferase involved in cell wall biosynthesis